MHTYPLDLLGACWNVTLPTGKAGAPDTIKLPALMTYTGDYFRLNDAGNGVVFTAPTNGVTTKNSKHPRSELRELLANGELAAWSSKGRHSLEIEQSIDALPIGSKPIVVAGQIHDAGDDVTVFRVEGSTVDRNKAALWITDGDSSHGFKVTDSYRIGERFRCGFIVEDDIIRYTYNGKMLDYTQTKKLTGCYFKAGSYCQSGGNTTPLPDGRADFAQVTIYNVRVCHDGVCVGTPGETPAGNDGELATRLAALRAEFADYRAVNDARWTALRAALKTAFID